MTSNARPVPPSPEVLSAWYEDYFKYGKPKGLSFQEYLLEIGIYFGEPSDAQADEIELLADAEPEPELIAVPTKPITDELFVKVLLVDFPDRPIDSSKFTPDLYKRLLFDDEQGCLKHYYKEISLNKVTISGDVSQWLRMPQPYSYYVNEKSGVGLEYPKNSKGLAVDAVKEAVNKGVEFPTNLDKFSSGYITALFIVHSGKAAEKQYPEETWEQYKQRRNSDMWSHKWQIPTTSDLNEFLAQHNVKVKVDRYLVVPKDCSLGLCAHELGHLAFQWDDFYDSSNNPLWDGSGKWDLMGRGSWNGEGEEGECPAHPAGLHKLQHGWVEVGTIRDTTSLSLKPYTQTSGKVFKIISPVFNDKQYLLLENRIQWGYDSELPGKGLLVWRVDESKGQKLQENPDEPGLLLIQADGLKQLENPNDDNQGDAGDPFPGSTKKTELLDIGEISTSFPNQAPSRISLKNIYRNLQTGEIKLDVFFSFLRAKDICIVANPQNGNLEAFLIDLNGKVYYNYFDSQWHQWLEKTLSAGEWHPSIDSAKTILVVPNPIDNNLQGLLISSSSDLLASFNVANGVGDVWASDRRPVSNGTALSLATAVHFDNQKPFLYLFQVTPYVFYNTIPYVDRGEYKNRWSPKNPMGIDAQSIFPVNNPKNGNLEVFVVGLDNKIYHNWFDRKWNNWSADHYGIGGVSGKSIYAIANPKSNNLVLFLVGLDNKIYHNWFDGKWNNWSCDRPDIGGVSGQSISAVANPQNNNLEVFMVGLDNKIYHNCFDGKWNNWSCDRPGIGGVSGKKIFAVCTPRNNSLKRIELFLIGLSDEIYYNYFEDKWMDWTIIL